MALDGFVISTGADGRLDGMTPDDVARILDTALDGRRLVLHFHGGLVNRAAGLRIAEELLPVYSQAGAYPLFFVWSAGAMEIVRHNVLEIAREEIFERVVRRVLSWAVGAVRAQAPGACASRGAMRPRADELQRELAARRRATDPDLGSEPFAEEAVPAPAPGVETVPDLTRAEEKRFLAEVASDADLRLLVEGVVADRGFDWVDDAGVRGASTAPPVRSRIDDDVLAEIASGDAEGVRGLVSSVALARKTLQVLRAVLGRYRGQTDSGVYPTVVEEVLRAFYLANVGGALWQAMKQETEETFKAGSTDRGGRLVIDRLVAGLGGRSDPRITLVGHSTGAVFIDHLLRVLVDAGSDGGRPWPAQTPLQVCFLAPACTTRHFAETLDTAAGLIGRFRAFTMTDEKERADRLVGAVYPRSLLYLVSGLLERDRSASAVAPLVGLARYLAPAGLERLLGSDLGRTARLAAVRTFYAERDRFVLSPTVESAPAGMRSSAVSHGGFDDDNLVRASLAHMIRTW